MVRRTRPQMCDAHRGSRDSPMCNRTSEVRCFATPRNDVTNENLPIAVESIAAIVIAAAAIAAIVNPEHALDGAHRPTDAGSNRAADHTAYGAGDPVAFPGAFLRAANDTLRMPDMGNRQQCEHDGRDTKIEFCGKADRKHRCIDPDLLHLNSSCSAIPGRRGTCNADSAKRLRVCGKFRTGGPRVGPLGNLRGPPNSARPTPCLRPAAHQ